jgi:cell division protein FtsB
MRSVPLVPLVLVALIALMQYPLWLGKGSWLRVWELDRQARMQRETNDKLQKRNSALEAEVRDLKQGLEAIEERARYQLGMIKQDEVFFRLVDGDGAPRGAPANH